MTTLGMLVLAAATTAAPIAEKPDKADLAVVYRIKDEAFRGEVMDHLFQLTDVNGPRLTGSPEYEKAARWAVGQLKGWGITTARIEPWGPFGRSWRLRRFSAHLREPVYAPLHGVLKAWSAGTEGPLVADVVSAPLTQPGEPPDFEPEQVVARVQRWEAKHKGQLQGRMVLLDVPREPALPEAAPAARHDEKRLGELGDAPEPEAPLPWTWPLRDLPFDPAKRARLMSHLPSEVTREYSLRMLAARRELYAALRREGVAAAFRTDRRSEGALVFAEGEGAWQVESPIPPPIVVLPPEEYARIARLVEKKVPVKVELEADVATSDTVVDGLNVVAEIPGGAKKDEIVMIGAHLDSWHGGTGATDNAAGCAVMMEAIRILRKLDLPLARTVRLALWGGEEQGLIGSRAYVKRHFADPITMKLEPEHARLSAYFNLDNGSGRIRGIYLQENDMVRPIFDAWMTPFRDLGARTISPRRTGGTDHLSFDAVGLPGFQFLQDPLEYGSRTHHSDLDVYDHAVPADLMQSAAVVASFVYHAANRGEKLPRKPLPPPLPQQTPLPGSAGGQ